MSLEVVFSSQALETASAITMFIHEQWGSKSAEKFVESVYKKIELISMNPSMYKSSDRIPDAHIAFINPHCSFVYTIHPDHIYIVYFWDNRQQPIT